MATSASTGVRHMSPADNRSGLGARLASIRSWPSDVLSAPARQRCGDPRGRLPLATSSAHARISVHETPR
jgi:hypothetical protein